MNQDSISTLPLGQIAAALDLAHKRLTLFKRTAQNAKAEGREDMGHFHPDEFWETEDEAALKAIEIAQRAAMGETAMFPEAM